MTTNPQALILYGDGINCEHETKFALELVGFDTKIMLTSDLFKSPKLIEKYQLLAFPGGFSFGDEIYSGKVLALQFEQLAKDYLIKFIEQKNIVLGICNGFQVLVNLGILPDLNYEPMCQLNHNSQNKFINRWVNLSVNSKLNNPLLKNLTNFELPIRHGEGNLIIKNEKASEIILQHAALFYENDVNGSFAKIAALTNKTGNVLGMMPHPEAFVTRFQHYNWLNQQIANDQAKPYGYQVFLNAYNYFFC